jgi:hypothetical protein
MRILDLDPLRHAERRADKLDRTARSHRGRIN